METRGGSATQIRYREIRSTNPQDIMVVFARDVDTDEIGCYILHLDSPGVTREKIQGKLPLRPVQNMQLTFQNV